MPLPKLNLDKILKLPLKKRLGILAGINAVVIALVGYLLLFPKISEIGKLNEQMNELNEKLAENRSIAADVPKYLRDKERMEQQLVKALAQLPNEKEIPDLIESVSSAGGKSGLNILLFKPGRESARGFYAEIPINMTVEGRFESLYDFAEKISKLPRIVNIGSMDVSTTGFKNRSPVLKASFVATTFRFIPTQPDEKDKDKKAAASGTPGTPEGEKK